MSTKFKIGDKVEIINYGSIIWESINSPNPTSFPVLHKNDTTITKDMSPELLGRQGFIEDAKVTQGHDKYAIKGIPGKYAWFDNQQLKLVEI